MKEVKKAALFGADAKELADSVKEAFTAVIARLEAAKTGTDGTRLFPSGVELISLTLKVGPNVEFSIRVAGKDAPKVEGALQSETPETDG
jgi:hypothetical protein